MSISSNKNSDPKPYAAKVAQLLEEVAIRCQRDIRILKEPKIKAVLEEVADGALGLRDAVKHYKTEVTVSDRSNRYTKVPKTPRRSHQYELSRGDIRLWQGV